MEWFDWIFEVGFGTQILLALLAKYLLYVAFKKASELTAHADANMLTSIVIASFNLVAVYFFVDDVNDFLQAQYDALGIPTLDPAIWDGLPLFVVCIIGIITKDFADYWSHRAMHTKWGWPTHAAHHSDTHVNAFTGLRVHFLESFLMTMAYVLLLTWMQIPEIIPIVALFYAVQGIYIHLDLDWDHGRFKYLFASPRYHRWHHADVPEAYGKNLASVVPLFDVMFGTYYNPGVCKEEMGALKTGVPDKNPLLIYIYPFREWADLIRDEVTKLSEKLRKSRTKS
ncbi:sterol desaturase family protein [Loktanella sp. Alg231-35]|uniref:sterol desaturase family protein n=1 Tax=Loktanella sp. Alg231-35 TaxID=1922220 RepID=UPI000D56223A|nr:sterol desaturase family protein [Loktanella sp. Alg231-35]